MGQQIAERFIEYMKTVENPSFAELPMYLRATKNFKNSCIAAALSYFEADE
jgi:glucose-6-phosphate 1-dehydrogenase